MASPHRELDERRDRALAWLDENRYRYSLLEAAWFLMRHSLLDIEGDDPGLVRITHSSRMGLDVHEYAIESDDRQQGSNYLTGTVFGLFGASTPMPLYFAEEALSVDDGAAATRNLLDSIHHRLFAALLDALKRLCIPESLCGESSPWVDRLIALADAEDLPARTVLQLLPILLSGDRSQQSIERAIQLVLVPYVGEIRVKVQQFTGSWAPLMEEQQTRLGTESAGLGTTFIAGDSIHMPSSDAHLTLGPVSRRYQHHFVRNASAHRALATLLSDLIPSSITLSAEIHLVNDNEGAILGVSRLSNDFILAQSDLGEFSQTAIDLDLSREDSARWD